MTGTPSAPAAAAAARPWRAAGLATGTALMLGLAGAMAYVAAAAPLLDAALLGLGAAAMIGFALSRQWWWSQPRLRPPSPWLGAFGSPWLIYPLGTALLARFLLLPAELWTALIGAGAGIVFLLPVLLVLFYLLMQVSA